MRFVPDALSRKIAEQALLTRKHSPTILLGVGVVGMVSSTVLACRATLKVEGILEEIEAEKNKASQIKHHVESKEYTGKASYSDDEMAQDIRIILVRGGLKIAKLYAPAVIVGGIGVVCLTKSHAILQDRNTALAAAYITVDNAFQAYRARVIERYGEDADRDFRYGAEDVDRIDEDTGKVTTMTVAAPGEPSGYARWFDETNNNWTAPPYEINNRVFLRSQQNWANDMLKARGHLFLNEVYSMLGLTHTSAGAIVGWLYERDNPNGDNYVDFGCWDHDKGEPLEFYNGRPGSVLLDFNVDGPIWQLMDEKYKNKEES